MPAVAAPGENADAITVIRTSQCPYRQIANAHHIVSREHGSNNKKMLFDLYRETIIQAACIE